MKNIEWLSFNEIIFCMILAFIILIIVNVISFFRKLSRECEYPLNLFDKFKKDFYVLFSKEVVMYKGLVLKRGMIIQVTTLEKNMYEGVFVGFNGVNMICIITNTAIVTKNIKNIKDIALINKQI